MGTIEERKSNDRACAEIITLCANGNGHAEKYLRDIAFVSRVFDDLIDIDYAVAVNCGKNTADVEAKYVDDAEFEKMMAAQIEAGKTYAERRRAEYPSITDYADAKVKQGSLDPVIQEEGRQQEAKYVNDCLAVKAKYPIPK